MELLLSTEALCKSWFNAEIDVSKLKASEQNSLLTLRTRDFH